MKSEIMMRTYEESKLHEWVDDGLSHSDGQVVERL